MLYQLKFYSVLTPRVSFWIIIVTDAIKLYAIKCYKGIAGCHYAIFCSLCPLHATTTIYWQKKVAKLCPLNLKSVELRPVKSMVYYIYVYCVWSSGMRWGVVPWVVVRRREGWGYLCMHVCFNKNIKYGVIYIVNVLLICRPFLVMLYIWNLSNVLSLGPFFYMCSISIVWSSVSYLCPASRVCCANLEFCLLVLMVFMCSL
jgi:hypothetical protein